MAVTLPPVRAFDHAAAAAARERLDQLAKPRGALGRLEDLVAQLAGTQGTARPRSRPARLFVFAADHPVTQHGVSAYPSAVTAAIVAALRDGRAAGALGATHLGVPTTLLDVGVDGGVPGVDRAPGIDQAGDLRVGEAMSVDTLRAAWRAGAGAVADAGPLSVALFGEVGIGNTTVAAAVATALLGETASFWVGRGAGVDDDGLARKVAVVTDAVGALPSTSDPWRVAMGVGGRELVALAGGIVQATSQGTAVLVDGFIVTVAALLAVRVAPWCRAHLVFAHHGSETAHGRVLHALGASALLDLGLRLGEGTGAVAALPLLDLACAWHDGLPTFAEAAVPDREAP